jgi:hypothetical protein
MQKTMRGEGGTKPGGGLEPVTPAQPTPVSGAPKAPAGVDPTQARKEAMMQTSTPEGRAQTNPDSPIAKTTESDRGDELIQKLKRVGEESPLEKFIRELSTYKPTK